MKKTKLVIISFSIFFLIAITYFTFAAEIRRKILTYIFVTHDYYRLNTLTIDIQNRNFSGVSEKLNNYIDISKKLSSEKSYMIPGIYNAIELAASNALDQEDFNYLEKPLLDFVDMEPKLYKPNVWLARALSDNDYQKSITLLKKAISISPSEETAYREILRIAQVNQNNELVNEYCDIFFKSQLGGNTDNYDYGYLFTSNNLKKFAIKFNSENKSKLFYYHSGIQLEKLLNYEFLPKEPLDIFDINLYFSFLPGVNIIIKEIILYNESDKIIIPSDKLIITSDSSFISDANDQVSIFSLKQGDEIIRISFDNKSYFKEINKVQLKINFKKMKLANNYFCN